MKIEVWSDFVCPFCYIGKRKLEEALNNFSYKEQVEIEFKSYQLDPNTPAYDGQDYYETMAKKFGSIERVKQMTHNVAEQAKLVGLNFNFDTMKQANTFKAHRLTKLAKEEGKDLDLTERLLQAHFVDSEDIGNDDTLLQIATEVNLNKEKVNAVLQDEDAYEEDVNHDINEARQFEITGVPFFLFNRKYALSGAQPTEVFEQALNQVWEEEQKQVTFDTLAEDNNGTTCADDNCAMPEDK